MSFPLLWEPVVAAAAAAAAAVVAVAAVLTICIPSVTHSRWTVAKDDCRSKPIEHVELRWWRWWLQLILVVVLELLAVRIMNPMHG